LAGIGFISYRTLYTKPEGCLMKIALGCFMQESHSFSPVPGSWAHFGPGEIHRGNELAHAFLNTRTELGGVLNSSAAAKAEVVPLISARATASAGPMEADIFAAISNELLDRLRQTNSIDGLLLVLHGAMVAEDYPDASGEVLRRCREVVGPDIPIVATLDLHANVTRQMVAIADGLVGYHTAPHVDLFETGQRGFSLLAQIISKSLKTVMVHRQLPMILPGENGRTTEGPYKAVMDLVESAMLKPGILDASAFSVQPWLDVNEVGCSVVVVCEHDAVRLAEVEANNIADGFWRRRKEFDVQLVPLEIALRRALESESHPVVISEPADAPSSGAPGDSTALLEALLSLRPTRECFLNIVDPIAVQTMNRAGIGQTVTFSIGAAYAPAFYEPVNVTGRVRLICDGDYVIKSPGMQGMVAHRGLTGVLEIGPISLVVMERPIIQWDPELYHSVGLNARDAQLVQVKSPAAFRAAYTSFAAQIVLVDTPGVCSPDLRAFNFSRAARPLYPLDDLPDWRIQR
jgi:microcystin degradation protein MlrC